MILSITSEGANASDMGYLLHKHPDNIFEANLWFGRASVFYPEATEERCTATLLLQVDPVNLVRGKQKAFTLEQYVNDRSYVVSSFMSVALIEAYRSAINGNCKHRPELVERKFSLTARLCAVSCRAGEEVIRRLFEPLGYTCEVKGAPLSERFPEWGESSVFSLTLRGEQTIQDLLSHLYVLIPVLDNAKHYYIADEEVDKLLQKGERWLMQHPEKTLITNRYLAYRKRMVQSALDRLAPLVEEGMETQEEKDAQNEAQEATAEAPLRLNEVRLQAALEAVLSLEPKAVRVIDLGCGEGNLLRMLIKQRAITEIVGVDVAVHTLNRAADRLRMESYSEAERQRVKLIQGSLVYHDTRFNGFDVATLLEVIEHIDAPRLVAMEKVVFANAKPRRVIVTTPNADYNTFWESLPAGQFRHRDHRFEWTREEFESWAKRVGGLFGYSVQIQGVGAEQEGLGFPTQMAVFDRA
ncbi:MAG: 3' terminal RNA ribose 2'-O-methyltransferase Hen1 [Armatimonadetes bacterium]|nr:3' terminal RNA ribose 2'-O-methyltransferase Hen1 [Armatimonadota bacterium]